MQALVQMDTAVKAVEERFVGQESSIEQRLKWAAGANPALNPVLQNFEKALNDRKKLLSVRTVQVICIVELYMLNQSNGKDHESRSRKLSYQDTPNAAVFYKDLNFEIYSVGYIVR